MLDDVGAIIVSLLAIGTVTYAVVGLLYSVMVRRVTHDIHKQKPYSLDSDTLERELGKRMSGDK